MLPLSQDLWDFHIMPHLDIRTIASLASANRECRAMTHTHRLAALDDAKKMWQRLKRASYRQWRREERETNTLVASVHHMTRMERVALVLSFLDACRDRMEKHASH